MRTDPVVIRGRPSQKSRRRRARAVESNGLRIPTPFVPRRPRPLREGHWRRIARYVNYAGDVRGHADASRLSCSIFRRRDVEHTGKRLLVKSMEEPLSGGSRGSESVT